MIEKHYNIDVIVKEETIDNEESDEKETYDDGFLDASISIIQGLKLKGYSQEEIKKIIGLSNEIL